MAVQKMASPQLEDGYTQIANEILEALARINLSAYQWRIVMVIWRKTYGWKKKEDRIPGSQIVKMTDLHKSHVSRTIKELKERRIVTNSGNKIAFNKNYSEWRGLYRKVTSLGNSRKVTLSGNKVTSLGNKKLPHKADSKEKKETIQNIHAQNFIKFWKAYPNKVAKKKTYEAWEKLEKAEDIETLLPTLLDAIEKQKQAKETLKAKGKFTPEWPHGATWLNGRRWEDEIEIKQGYDGF